MLEIRHIVHAFHKSALKTWLALVVLLVITFFMGVVQVYNDTRYPQYNIVLEDHIHNLYKADRRIADFFLVGSVALTMIYFLFVYTGTDPNVPLRLIFRRMFWILAVLYLFRTITISVTILPTTEIHCDLRRATDTSDIFMNAVEIITGKFTCTDLMFSGHTFIMLIALYFIDTYGQFRWGWLRFVVLSVLYGVFVVGAFFIITGLLHYTVDVIVSIMIAYGVYNNYHAITQYRIYINHFHFMLPQWSPDLMNDEQRRLVPRSVWYRWVIGIVDWMDRDF